MHIDEARSHSFEFKHALQHLLHEGVAAQLLHLVRGLDVQLVHLLPRVIEAAELLQQGDAVLLDLVVPGSLSEDF